MWYVKVHVARTWWRYLLADEDEAKEKVKSVVNHGIFVDRKPSGRRTYYPPAAILKVEIYPAPRRG